MITSATSYSLAKLGSVKPCFVHVFSVIVVLLDTLMASSLLLLSSLCRFTCAENKRPTCHALWHYGSYLLVVA